MFKTIRPKPGQGVIDLSTRQRFLQKKLGIKVARSKLLDSVNPENENSSENTWFDSESSIPPLLFRRGEEQTNIENNGGENLSRGDYSQVVSGTPVYKSVTFLNDEVVLASNSNLQIDAIRLPVNFQSRSNIAQGDASRRLNDFRGTLVANQLGNPCQSSMNACMELKSLSNGQSFVAGSPSGDLEIFATEREFTWTKERFEHCLSSRKVEPKVRTVLRHDHVDEKFLRMVLHLGAPRRRYYRNFTNAKLSLQTLISDLSASNSALRYELSEIPDWDMNSSLLDTEYQTSRVVENKINKCSWDFREIGSTLLAAHVHPQKDCFSIHTIDNNVQYIQNRNGNASSKHTGNAKPLVCLDTKPCSSHRKMLEDIVSVCFVGDWGIATAHTLVGRRPGNSRKEVMNILKFWDRRMIVKNSIKKSTVNLISFPCVESVPLMPTRHRITGSEKVELFEESPPYHHHHLPIVGLFAGAENSNTIAISFHGSGNVQNAPCDITKDLFVDAINLSITRTVRLTSIQNTTQLHLPVFSADIDFMARYFCQDTKGVHSVDDEEMILLYDLSTTSLPDTMEINDYSTTRQRKRKHYNNEKEILQNHHNANTILPLKLFDEYGLASSFTCIGMNGSGTRIAVGSLDGDLFMY